MAMLIQNFQNATMKSRLNILNVYTKYDLAEILYYFTVCQYLSQNTRLKGIKITI